MDELRVDKISNEDLRGQMSGGEAEDSLWRTLKEQLERQRGGDDNPADQVR